MTSNLSTLAVLFLAVLSQPVHPSILRRKSMFSLAPQRKPRNALESTILRIPQLHLRSPPTAPVIVSVSENKILECEAMGSPPPTIFWRKNGKKLSQDPDNTVAPILTDENNDDFNQVTGLTFTKSRLYLDCVTPVDEGVYTCVAKHPEHTISSDTVVNVVESGNPDDVPTCVEKKSFGKPARIFLWTHKKLELMGTDVQLFCRSEGQPRPEIRWISPDEKSIEDDNKFEILPSGDLIIRNIEWEDVGDYVCISENEYGTDQVRTFLYPARREKRQ